VKPFNNVNRMIILSTLEKEGKAQKEEMEGYERARSWTRFESH